MVTMSKWNLTISLQIHTCIQEPNSSLFSKASW